MENQMTNNMDKIVKRKYWTKQRIVFFCTTFCFFCLLIYILLFSKIGLKLVDLNHLQIGEAKVMEFKDYTILTGKVVPEKIIYLDAMEGGRIEEIYKEEGSVVKKGERILRLSNSNLQMNLMNREAELADQMNNLRNTRLQMEQTKLSLKGQLIENEYQIKQAKRDYQNNMELFDRKMISKQEFLKGSEQYDFLKERHTLLIESMKQDSLFRVVQIDQLNDSVRRLQQNLQLIREKMDGLTITAPLNGQLTALKAEIGEAKGAGERLGTLNVIDSYKIEAIVNEYYLNKVRIGVQAVAELENTSYKITLTKVNPEVSNGTFKVEFLLNDKIKDLYIGQSFVIRLELGKTDKCLVIPKGSFLQQTGGQWIFVIDKDMKKARKRMIKTGRQNPDYYEILSGLNSDEKVILSGYENFDKAELLKIKKEGKK